MALRYCCILAFAAAVDCQPPTECVSFCRTTYHGQRNFYNATDATCYPVPVCSAGLVLSQLTNVCMSPKDFVPNLTPQNTTQNPNQGTEVPDKPLDCVHGRLVSNATCVCDTGYTTSRTQDSTVSTVKMCDVKGADTSTPDGYVENGDGSLYRSDQVTGASGFFAKIPLIYVVIIAAVVCVLLCITTRCVLAYCKRKHAAKQLLPPPRCYMPRFKG